MQFARPVSSSTLTGLKIVAPLGMLPQDCEAPALWAARPPNPLTKVRMGLAQLALQLSPDGQMMANSAMKEAAPDRQATAAPMFAVHASTLEVTPPKPQVATAAVTAIPAEANCSAAKRELKTHCAISACRPLPRWCTTYLPSTTVTNSSSIFCLMSLIFLAVSYQLASRGGAGKTASTPPVALLAPTSLTRRRLPRTRKVRSKLRAMTGRISAKKSGYKRST
mmetsp:Transcript_17627/g.36843  ORF Transcript_17627/g.36843 Transcript_17627/m.36843 type:complete len:223 (+) Transcript_17627:536-1204(+)